MLGRRKDNTHIKYSSLPLYYEIVEMVGEEKESVTVKNYTISSESITSSDSLHETGIELTKKKKNIFVSFSFSLDEAGIDKFTTRASVRYSYFLLRSYSPSTLASLVHLDFSPPLNPGPSSPSPGQHLKRRDVKCLLCSALCSLLIATWLKTSVIIYFSDAYTPLVTLPIGIQTTQFTWHFHSILFTLRQKCFLYLKSTNSHGLSKVNI